MPTTVMVVDDCVTTEPDTGVRVRLRKGEAYRSDHPLVKAMPGLFVAMPEVEQATQGPGERRRGRPRG